MKTLSFVLIAVVAIAHQSNNDNQSSYATPAKDDFQPTPNKVSFTDIDRHIYAQQLGLSPNASWDEIRTAIASQEYPTR